MIKDKTLKLRVDKYSVKMLDYLTQEFNTNRSQLIRTLIMIAYEKQKKGQSW